MNLTKEQQLAVDLEGSNIIVSAGAGSGKTAVLSERVIRKLKDGVDIRDILILTFTNEAAGEMSTRIRKKMKKAGLDEQLVFLDQAYIMTFDAFALNLVKKYHYIVELKSENIWQNILVKISDFKSDTGIVVKNFDKLVALSVNSDAKFIINNVLSI